MTGYRAWVAAALAAGMAIAGCGDDDEGRVAAYGACAESADCAAGVEGCVGVQVDYVEYVTAERFFCSSLCTSDDECPPGPDGVPGACGEELGGGSAACFRRCSSDDVCPESFECVDRLPATGGGVSIFHPICLPVR